MKTLCLIVLITFAFMFSSIALATDVCFQWGMSTGEVDGYRIYWGETQNGPYLNKLCEVDEATFSYLATLDETQEYFLVCRAFNSYGESGNSNEVCWNFVVPGIPGSLLWSIDLIELMKNAGASQIKFVSD